MSGLNPVEQVVEGAKEASALVVDKVLQHVPGTAEHALRRDLKEMEAAQQQRQEQQAGQAGPKHVVFQEGVPHPDEKKGKLVRQPTPMPNVLKSAEKK